MLLNHPLTSDLSVRASAVAGLAHALTILHHLPGARCLSGTALSTTGTIPKPLLLDAAVRETGLGLHHAITVLDHLLLHRSHLTAVPVLAGPGGVPHALLASTSRTSPSSAASKALRAGNRHCQHHDNDFQQSIHQTTPLTLLRKFEPASLPQGRWHVNVSH
jgi:hypothetical protein